MLSDSALGLEVAVQGHDAASKGGTQRHASFSPALRAPLWIAGFLVVLSVSLQWTSATGVQNDFTQNVWLPSRLVLNGVNPYNPSLAEVHLALGSYSAGFPVFNSGRNFQFIYPMWLALLFAPLAAMPLTFATALWRALSVLLLVWSVGALLRTSNPLFRSLRPVAIGAVGLTILLAIIYRPSVQTLFLGQFAIMELGLLAAIWGWLIRSDKLSGRRRTLLDALVGLSMALLATKPQSVGLAVVLLGLWAISRRRWAIPVSALVSLTLLLVVPALFYRTSLGDWLGVVVGGQASSQVEVSASVWGLSYQLLSSSMPQVVIALGLSLLGVAALLPRWWRDLKGADSPVPLSLPLTICMNSVISPYMLGYEQTLLLMPALVLLSAVGLPGSHLSATEELDSRKVRLAIYAWLALLPWLILPVQSLVAREYLVVVQSATLLAVCWVTPLNWKRYMHRSSVAQGECIM